MLPDGGQAINLRTYDPRLQAAIEFAKRTGVMRRDTDAAALWNGGIYEDLNRMGPSVLADLSVRGAPYVLRISCLFALLDLSPVVRPSHLLAALDVWRYCFESARYVFGSRLSDSIADRIWQALKEQPRGKGLSQSDIYSDVLGGNVKSGKIRRALTDLAEWRLVTCERIDTGGRPADVWMARRRELTCHAPKAPVFALVAARAATGATMDADHEWGSL